MRLTEENSRKLERALWLAWLKQYGLGAAGIAAVLLPVLFLTSYKAAHVDKVAAEAQLTGKVVGARSKPADHPVVIVQLADGHFVDAANPFSYVPAKGSAVVLNDATFTSGRHVYRITKIEN